MLLMIGRSPAYLAVSIDYPPLELHSLGLDARGVTLRHASGGEFNQVVWRTLAYRAASDAMTEVVQMHERWHFELNNVSTVGTLLTSYAHLARHAVGGRERHERVCRSLLARCRRAHEVYATWHSVELCSAQMPAPELLALHAAEYQGYHAEGERIVVGLASPYLRQQAFLCAIRICFESAALAALGGDFETFELSCVQNREYPDARLERLKQLPEGFFQRALESFLAAEGGSRTGLLVARAADAERRESRQGIEADEEDAATGKLHEWLHRELARFFEERRLPANPFGHHLVFLAESIPRLNSLCVDSAPQFAVNANPHDNAANLLIQAENEILFARESRLPASICPFHSIPPAARKGLGVGNPAHLFLCVRTAAQILRQHDLCETDVVMLAQMAEPVVFLRRTVMDPAGLTCQLILLNRPEELASLKEAAPLPGIASLSMSVLASSDWYDQWMGPLCSHFQCTILFDLSLAGTLRRGWPEFKKVHYAKGTMQHGDSEQVFLAFLGIYEGPTYAVYLLPCTRLFMGAVTSFIRQRLPPERFVEDDQFLRELHDVAPVVMQHLLAEEHYFSLNLLDYEH